MAEEIKRCQCARCRIRALMGPVVLIILGVLFLVGQFGRYSFTDLWPILLIGIGVVKVAESLASDEGHAATR